MRALLQAEGLDVNPGRRGAKKTHTHKNVAMGSLCGGSGGGHAGGGGGGGGGAGALGAALAGALGSHASLLHWEVDQSRPGQDWAAAERFKAVGLERPDVDKFWTLFCKIDASLTGSITSGDFFAHFRLERTPFAERCFSVFDKDGSDEIDFSEFTHTLWTFLTVSEHRFVSFAFRLYDTLGNDRLTTGEVEQLVADVYGPHWADNKKVTERALKAMDQDEDGIVSMAEFEAAVKKYHNLLLPAFSMQLKLKERSFGASWWAKATSQRKTPPKNNADANNKRGSPYKVTKKGGGGDDPFHDSTTKKNKRHHHPPSTHHNDGAVDDDPFHESKTKKKKRKHHATTSRHKHTGKKNGRR